MVINLGIIHTKARIQSYAVAAKRFAMDISASRKDYRLMSLTKHSLLPDPFDQFEKWLHEAIAAKIIEPTAMTLATATIDGRPGCRTVLLKHVDKHGLVFFTNAAGRKAREIQQNPFATALFWWRELERQATVEGTAEETSREETEAYFAKRPRGSQLGAWASNQDTPIPSRDFLEKAYKKLEEQFAGRPIPAPPFWTGFRIKPHRFEFWQGRSDRLHDRFCYTQQQHSWIIDCLSP